MSSDSLEAIREVNQVARSVATEILAGYNAHSGSRWQTVDGDEKAVRFDVFSASLADKSVSELDKTRVGDTGGFRFALSTAGGRYVNGHLRGKTLHGIGIDKLEVVDGVYTGNITIHDGSGAWDYDL